MSLNLTRALLCDSTEMYYNAEFFSKIKTQLLILLISMHINIIIHDFAHLFNYL